MKKNLLLFLFGILISFSGMSQDTSLTVSGFVFDLGNNYPTPVAGQAVTIMIDSTTTGFSYTNDVITDDSGFYSDIISLPPAVTQGMVHASTFDSCLGFNQYQAMGFHPGMNAVMMDFMLCDNTPPPQCEAFFFYYPGDSVNPSPTFMTYQFVDASFGMPTQWLWDFGDGTTSTEQNPIHTFADEGIYQVCLTISDDSSICQDTYCEEVRAGFPGGSGCENYFLYTYQTNTLLDFEGYLLSGQQAISYDWDFGDGTTGSGQYITHEFEPAGFAFFTVCLTTTVLDSIGDTTTYCTYTSCQDVWLENQWDCMAMFRYFPDSLDPFAVNFIDMSFTINGNAPDSWYWDFGDSTFSTEQNPVHLYPDTGEYYVCLTITDSMGNCTNTYCEPVWVGLMPPPFGCYNYFEYTQDDSLTFTFTGEAFWNGTTNPAITTYTWEFGDGTTGTGQTVTHTYPSGSTMWYTVCLETIIVDTTIGDPCTAISCQDVWIGGMNFNISGVVYLGGDSLSYPDSLLADVGFVHLYTFDTLYQNLIVVETTGIMAGGYYEFEELDPEPCRIYYVQAELSPNSAYFNQYVPTYHLSALNWEWAWPVLPWPGMYFPADIYMIPASSSNSGSGEITGTISDLNVRSGQMADVEILLLNQDDEPLQWMRSDENGEFDFSSLALGTYYIYAELIGINTIPAMVTLTAEEPDANINIIVKNGEAVLSVPESSLVIIDHAGEVYPNPITNNARVSLRMTEAAVVELHIFNQIGQLVSSKAVSLSQGQHDLDLDLDGVQQGIHLLRISTNHGDLVTKRFIRIK